MEFKVGDRVICNTQVRKGRYKYILSREPTEPGEFGSGNFLVIGINERDQTYIILLEDDMVGWNVGFFQCKYYNVDTKYLAKKYWEISEEYVCGKYKK